MDSEKEIEAKANVGDAAAQYRMAAMLDQRGDLDGAKRWLNAAADAGHPAALYTIATQLLSKTQDEMPVDEAVALLRRAMDAGNPAAMGQLAVLSAFGLGIEQSWREAVSLLRQAAQTGYPPSVRELGMLWALAGGEAAATGAFLRAAAMNGDWVSQYLGLRRGDVFSAAEGEAICQRLKAGGAPLGRRLTVSGGPGLSDAPPDIDAAASAVAALDILKPVAPTEHLHRAPDIFRVDGILSEQECDYLICTSYGSLQGSKVVDHEKSAASHAHYRSSDEARMGLLEVDLMTFALYARMAMAAGVDHGNCELMNVLRYQPGQEYKPHYDFLPEDAKDFSQVRRSGQRTRTVITVLCDDFTGGETRFPRLDKSIRAKAGDAIVFHNTDDNDKPYKETLHAGAPVTAGEKWIVTVWCRARRLWFWP